MFEQQGGWLMWAALDDGTYQHIFYEVEKKFKMQGQLVSWASICGRSFAIKEPQPNTKKKKCVYCLGKENGNCNKD